MKRVSSWLAVLATLVVASCQPDTSKTWFKGDFEAALAAADARGTQVMIEFYADWCNWCRRLEADTFSAPEVRRELQALVSLKVDAEKEGAELARRFDIDTYPTIVFSHVSDSSKKTQATPMPSNDRSAAFSNGRTRRGRSAASRRFTRRPTVRSWNSAVA